MLSKEQSFSLFLYKIQFDELDFSTTVHYSLLSFHSNKKSTAKERTARDCCTLQWYISLWEIWYLFGNRWNFASQSDIRFANGCVAMRLISIIKPEFIRIRVFLSYFQRKYITGTADFTCRMAYITDLLCKSISLGVFFCLISEKPHAERVE